MGFDIIKSDFFFIFGQYFPNASSGIKYGS